MQEIRESHIYHNGIPDWIEFWDSKTNETTRYVPERTCQNRDADIYPGGMVFVCSVCESMSTDGQPNYCPKCGAKVVD